MLELTTSPVRLMMQPVNGHQSVAQDPPEAASMTLGPTVIPEHEGDLIKFCRKKQVYIGFTWQGYIYKLVGYLPLLRQREVIDLSLQLEQHGHNVLLTASGRHYGVWTQL